MTIWFRSFETLTGHLARHSDIVPLPDLSDAQRRDYEDIAWSVRIAARYTPFRSACLEQALAGQSLLEKNGISGMFVLGLATRVSEEESEPLTAHAWVQCGKRVLIGEAGYRRFRPICAFTW